MQREIKASVIALSILFSLVSVNGFAKMAVNQDEIAVQQPSATGSVQESTTLHSGTVRAAEPLVIRCAKLRNLINHDKTNLSIILGKLSANNCYSKPAASSAICVSLFDNKEALEASIGANVRRANDLGCSE